MIDLAEIEQIIADHKPIPEPFNGATRLVLSKDLYVAIEAHMKPAFPFGGAPEIEVRPSLPPGYGVGYRPRRDGDDPDLVHDACAAETMVWFCGPKTDENRG